MTDLVDAMKNFNAYADVKFDFIFENNKLIQIYDSINGCNVDSLMGPKNNVENNRKVFNYIKDIECEQIIEMGVGAGSIEDILKDMQFNKKITYVEINKYIYEYWKCKGLDIIQGNLYNYIKHNVFENTIFSMALGNVTIGTNLFELKTKIALLITKVFSKQLGKNNFINIRVKDSNEILNIKSPILKYINCVKYIKLQKSHMISIKL